MVKVIQVQDHSWSRSLKGIQGQGQTRGPVYLQIAVADSELQIFQKRFVFHQIQRVENVKIFFFGQDESVLSREGHCGHGYGVKGIVAK